MRLLGSAFSGLMFLSIFLASGSAGNATPIDCLDPANRLKPQCVAALRYSQPAQPDLTLGDCLKPENINKPECVLLARSRPRMPGGGAGTTMTTQDLLERVQTIQLNNSSLAQ